MFGRYPLVILGAGISYGKVPLLKQLGSWFLAKLQREDLGEKDQWLLGHARAIESGAGSRRQAAEFFSTLQLLEHPYEKIWTDFSAGFLYKGLRFDGLASESGQSFDGLAKRSITPTDAHSILAKLMLTNEVSVISLNFDGLTHQAIRRLADCSVNLHTASEIDRYFCSSDQEYMSAIIKVRGDVFYARCANPSCPLSVGQYPIDRIALEGSGAGEPQCPSCQGKRLRLQFQFPGYRIKEESAIPVLAAAKRYLHNRASAIIVIGLSGRWDRYMLQFLFSLARERQVPLVDVKPFHDKRDEMIAEFKNLYYPTFSPQVPKHGEPQAAFVRIEQTADEFCTFLWSDALGHP
jgi:NAD-dependent SIR2 family protein deacetylase